MRPRAKAPPVGMTSPNSAAASSATSVLAQETLGSRNEDVSFQKAAEKYLGTGAAYLAQIGRERWAAP